MSPAGECVLMINVRHSFRNLAIDIRRIFRMFRELDREAVARQYLRGSGIEIGALHNPLKVHPLARVRYVDRFSVADLRKHYPELTRNNLVETDIVDDGETLRTIEDNSQDFVIASHFLEHCQDPITTLGNFIRVAKPGGILFICLPDKRYTFDSRRPVTPFEHLMKDYREGPAWSRASHFEEWVTLVENLKDGNEKKRRLEQLLAINYSIHYHVWTQTEILEFFERVRLELHFPIELQVFMKNDIEVITVFRKLEQK